MADDATTVAKHAASFGPKHWSQDLAKEMRQFSPGIHVNTLRQSQENFKPNSTHSG